MDFSTYIKLWLKHIPKRTKLFDTRAKSIFDIDFSQLKKEGFQLIIFDVDDTIDDFLGEISQRSIDFLKSLQEMGFKLGAFSNSKPKRTAYLSELFPKVGIYNVVRSDKPNPAGYLEIMSHYKIGPNETIMLGDKVGTDMFGAYNAGIKHKILVEPFSHVFGGKKAKSIDRFVRNIEKLFSSKN